jgi:hypothetical protein
MAVAVPFERDPWGTVAQGLRMDRDVLVAALIELQQAGVILGVWGEPNPALVEARETLVEFPDENSYQPAHGQVVRWRARKPHGGWLASITAIGRSAGTGWEATRFAKAGLPLQGTGATADLLRSGADRTHLVNGDRIHIPRSSTRKSRSPTASSIRSPSIRPFRSGHSFPRGSHAARKKRDCSPASWSITRFGGDSRSGSIPPSSAGVAAVLHAGSSRTRNWLKPPRPSPRFSPPAMWSSGAPPPRGHTTCPPFCWRGNREAGNPPRRKSPRNGESSSAAGWTLRFTDRIIAQH